MLSRHEIYEETDYTPAQKIILFCGVAFALVLIAIVGEFIYQFIQTYHQQLSHGLFYLLSVICVALAISIAAVTAYGVVMLMLRYESARLASLQQAQDLQATTINNALFTATTEQITNGRVYLSEQKNDYGVIKFKSLAKSAPKPAEPLLNLPELDTTPDIKDDLLSDIAQAQRLLIVGGQNSGKTTLLKHIAHQRSGAGSVLIIDSHNTVGKWARDYRIVGHGRDYSAIERELANLVAMMDTRYKELATGKIGERQHQRITVICDEWTTVSKNINNLNRYLLPLLTESRKVGIDLMLATHSQTAESLGLKGKADLKSAFDSILILKNIDGKRIIELNNGESIINYHHCGEFTPHYLAIEKNDIYIKDDFQSTLNQILNNPIIDNDLIKEQQIIRQYEAMIKDKTFTLTRLAKLIYGKNANGRQVAEIKEIIERHKSTTT